MKRPVFAIVSIFFLGLPSFVRAEKVTLVGNYELLLNLHKSSFHKSHRFDDASELGRQQFGISHENFYVRDSFIQRADGKMLIPRSLKNISYSSCGLRIKSFLPLEEAPFILESLHPYGDFGLRKESMGYAVRLAEKYKVEIVEDSTSALEGGNVFLLKQAGKAIVGIHSVALQLYLQEQDQLPNPAPAASATEHAFSIARNSALFSKGGLTMGQFRTAFAKPISEEERLILSEDAKLWQAKIDLAKTSITEDLGLRLEDVCFVVQQDYHLDLDLALSPNGVIFQSVRSAELAKIQRQQLEELGYKVHPIEGQHERGLVNALFLEKAFVGLQGPNAELEGALKKEGFETNPFLRTQQFEGFTAKTGAGLRCLTAELEVD